jgi:hypothetical protein
MSYSITLHSSPALREIRVSDSFAGYSAAHGAFADKALADEPTAGRCAELLMAV